MPRTTILPRVFGAIAPNILVLSGTTTKAAVMFVAPKTGTIDRIAFVAGTQLGANVRTLAVRLETVSGNAPSGSLVAAGAATTGIALPGSNTLAVVALTTPTAVTKGTTYAAVIQEDTGVWDASNTLNIFWRATGATGVGQSSGGLPHPLSFAAGSWTAAAGIPCFAPLYTDDDVPELTYMPADATFTGFPQAFTSASTPNEYGIEFTVSEPWTIDAADVCVRLTTAGTSTAEVSVYDTTSNPTGVLVASSALTLSPDADTAARANVGATYKRYGSTWTLPAGTYILAVRAPATTITLNLYGFYSAKAAERLIGHPVTGARRTYSGGAGAWTRDVTRVPLDLLLWGTPQNGVSSGGCPLIGPGGLAA